MNWHGLKTAGVWAHAMLSVAIVGGADAAANVLFVGDVNWKVVGSVALVGGVRAMVTHLKKAPLPSLTWPDPTEGR